MSDSLQPVQVGASYVVDRYDACISFFIHTPCSTCYFLPRIACIVVLANADADGVPASFVSPPPAACVYKTSLPMQNHSGCRRYKQVKTSNLVWSMAMAMMWWGGGAGAGAGLLSIQAPGHQQRNWRKSSTTTMQSANCIAFGCHTTPIHWLTDMQLQFEKQATTILVRTMQHRRFEMMDHSSCLVSSFSYYVYVLYTKSIMMDAKTNKQTKQLAS
jgi:hypothetical protein